MTDDHPLFFVERHRWSGSTPEDFRQHQVEHHASKVLALPGLRWYESFTPTEPDGEWPIQHGRGLPDCYDLVQFESEAAVEDLRSAREWQAVAKDNEGFVANIVARRVRRYPWVAEPETPQPYQSGAAELYPTVVFESYRWAGTTPEECLQHYVDVHLPLGLGLPGIRWYEAFLDVSPARAWPIMGRPLPDFNVVLQFESAEAVASLRGTQEWADAKRDDLGFVQNTFGRTCARFAWLPDPAPPPAYSR